jgi:hypothetical protein
MFVLDRSIVECIFCFCLFLFAILKIVFSKKMVDLNSCDIMNYVPNSSLTYNTRSTRGPMVV